MTDDAVLMQANTEKGEALLASLPMLEDAADDAAEESKAKTKAILEKLAAEKSVYRFLRRRQADGTVQLR